MLRFSVVLALSCLFIVLSLNVTKKDHLLYRKYITGKKEGQNPIVQQQRDHIQKDIWFFQDNQRKQCRISSDKSYFTFSKETNKANELLYNLSGWIQEEILDTSQKLRHFTSEEGIYSFLPHKFVSKQAILSFLEEKGNEIPSRFCPENVYMRAIADQILFDLTEKTPSFSASHLKAIFPNLKKEHVQSKKPH